VNETPVEPVKDELDSVVADVTGGSPTGSTPATAPAQTSAPSNQSAGPTAERRPTRRAARERGTAPRRARARGAPASDRDGEVRIRRAGRTARPRAASSAGPAVAADDGNALARTVEKLVEVVPRIVWIALGVLLAAALALGARTFVERRRARRLEREREWLLNEVGLLERALLPDVPEQLGALAASVAYRPCEGPAAGGDFYDAFELEGGRVAVLVGDVSGHGPEALENTNAIRTGVHACLEAGMSPRLALQAVGARGHAGSNGRYATAIVAVHDPSSGTLTYATAGHPPPIVTGPCAHEPLTAASSLPVGLGFRTGLRETTVPFPPGSLACLFTDGLLEARAGEEMIGREHLTKLVDGLAAGDDADALLERVTAESDECSDDMAVLILRAEAGMAPLAGRTEILEVDADDLESGIGELFLDACGLSADDTQRALEDARAATGRAGTAVLDVTIEDGTARARVSPAGAPASPTPA
jgi:hypothetical protein